MSRRISIPGILFADVMVPGISTYGLPVNNAFLPQWSFLATLAGPLFSCSLMWLGAWWIAKSSNHKKKVLGFSLLFANLPFARIFTALAGGGDEKVVIQAILRNDDPFPGKLIAALVVTLICLPPMIIAYRKLIGSNRFLLITGFAIIPLIYGMLYHHIFLNWLLKKGIASNSYMLGTPSLVLLHFLLMLLLLFFFRKGIALAGGNPPMTNSTGKMKIETGQTQNLINF